MKVIEAISDTNIGGAGRLLLTRLLKSDRNNVDTTVVLPAGSMLKEKVEGIGISLREIEGCFDKSFDVGAIFKLMRIIRDIEPDIVNCHGCMSARIAAFLCRVPVRIYTRHCAYPTPRYLNVPFTRWIVGMLGARISTNAIAVAEVAKGDLISTGFPSERIKVIINGVEGLKKYSDEERYRARRELGVDGSFVVGICARLEACKGHESFLRAARILIKDSGAYRFIVVGGGSLEDELKEFARNLGIADKVIFTGFSDDIEKYFNCFDLNVNCSVGTETSSLALSEGMSIGLPAVASSYGGNPYMIKHGENGFIYPVGDFYSLAQMIRRIAEDRELYERMSRAAYERYASELNSKKMTAETEAYYRELYIERVSDIEGLTSGED